MSDAVDEAGSLTLKNCVPLLNPEPGQTKLRFVTSRKWRLSTFIFNILINLGNKWQSCNNFIKTVPCLFMCALFTLLMVVTVCQVCWHVLGYERTGHIIIVIVTIFFSSWHVCLQIVGKFNYSKSKSNNLLWLGTSWTCPKSGVAG